MRLSLQTNELTRDTVIISYKGGYAMGERIKNLILLNNMTQDEVAERLNCSREKISLYETNSVKRPDYYFICSLAELFNVSSDYFKPQ